MKIQVTQEDIDEALKLKGTDFWCYICPIAQALQRMFPGERLIHVTQIDCYIGKLFKLPMVARAFIMDLDSGLTVQPFEFEL